MASAKRIVKFEMAATTTIGLSGDSTAAPGTISELNSFSLAVGGPDNSRGYAAYEWLIPSSVNTTFGVDDVHNAEVVLYYYGASEPDPIEEIEIVELDNATALSVIAPTTLWSDIVAATTVFATVAIKNGEKTRLSVPVTGTTTTLQTATSGGTRFQLAIRRKATGATERGQALLGGLTLARGVALPWRVNVSPEIADPPRLVIYMRTDVAQHSVPLMKYTTPADPTVSQSTPSSSVGGYAAPNEITDRTQVGAAISAADLSLTLAPGSTMPTLSAGLVQFGSEIAQYSGVNASTLQLTGLTRIVVPPFAYPAIMEPFPDNVHYLEVSDLFDTTPTDSLIQYRCVAIQMTSDDGSVEWVLNNVSVFVVQNPNADIRIDAGIEVPLFDRRTGTLAAGVSAGGNEITASTSGDSRFTVTGFADGFFNGAHLIIDPSGTAEHHIVDSYEFSSTTGLATFFLEDNTTAFAISTSFRINPAPAQIISDEITAPVQNSGRFTGFFGDGGSNTVKLIQHLNISNRVGNPVYENDHFYLWIKRTMQRNKKNLDDSGATILLTYNDL